MVSKDIMQNIDLEEGKIRVNGEWFTEDELRYAIRMKVDSDDYNVADLAVALKTLISEMNKSTILRLRVPKKLAEEIEDLSKQRGESLESMLRTILIDFINKEGERSGQLYEETVAYGDMELEGPKEEFKAQSVVVEMESEADEYPIARKEEDIGIRIEENVVEEEGVEGELLDLEATANGSEVDEFGSDEDFEDEDIFDIEAEDEEENELVVEDDEDLDEDLSEIEVVEEEPSQPEVEEIISHEEPEDIFEEKDLSDIEPFEEKKEETELKEFKPIPKKKKATKKKIVLRKKKLRHKKE